MQTEAGGRPDRENRDQITLDSLRQKTEVITPLYITLAQAARSLPPGRSGRPVHISTVLRWIVDGTPSPTRERVNLQAVRMGGRWLTTLAWLDDYARRLTPAIGGEPAMSNLASRTRCAERAARELDAIGI